MAIERLLLALSFGAFLTALDASAVNAVLTLIRHEFGASISAVQWVLTAELLVTSGLLLVFGRLGDRFGAVAVYRLGFGVFFCGCLLCGLAPTLTWLIACRAFQGIGTAMLLANSPAVLTRYVPAERSGFAFGIKASCLYVGLVAGPLLGGWLAGRFGWRAVFGMELPLALMGLALSTIFLPRDSPIALRTRYDVMGACVWMIGLGSLVWLLGRDRPVNVPVAQAAAVVVSTLMLIALIAVERRSAEPLFELPCFRRPAFSASVLSLVTAFGANQMLTFVLPFYWMEVRHRSPSDVGRLLGLYAMTRGAIAWLSGYGSDRVDGRWFTIPGLLLLAGGAAVLARAGESDLSVAGLVLAGLGFGCFVPPNNSALMGAVPARLHGFAAGIMSTSRTVGMTAGVAFAGAILSAAPGATVDTMHVALRSAALLAVVSAIISAFAAPRPTSPSAHLL